MTSWQRQAPGSASATLPVSNGETPDRSLPFSWDDWFRHASPQQRAAALGLAQQQGLLYPHQLPPITNGVKQAAAPVRETAVSAFLTKLLAGKTETLAPPVMQPITWVDAELDALQQQAVIRAISTPDIFLLQGLPGTGKSRVLTEIILQAAMRGLRVLFLGAHPASVDGVLERLVGRPEVFALRFLETHERVETLPAWLRGFTLEEQKQAFLERVLAGARGNRDEVEAVCRARRDEEPLWAELKACLARWTEAIALVQKLDAEIPQLAAVIEADPRMIGLRQACDAEMAAIDVELTARKEALAECQAELTEIAGRIAALEPGYRAKKHTRVWTPAFWFNLFNARLIPDTEALLEQQTQFEARRQTFADEVKQIEKRRQDRLDRENVERTALRGAEMEVRRKALEQVRQNLDATLRQLDAEWCERCTRLKVGPIDKTAAAIMSAHDGWLQRKHNDEEQCQFAHQWSKFIEEAGPQFAGRLPSFANLIAGTTQRWQADAKFQVAVGAPLDLVVLEDADTLTDADLLKLSRFGQRCVLSAQAIAELVPAVNEKTTRAPLAPVVCWQRLWKMLGGDAGVWPCAWRRENGRLVCQLLPLTTEDRQHLECERLADAPDIELCILHRVHTRPCLAEVSFAAASSFADAFRFLVREVQEFPLEPLGRTAWWCERDGQLRRRFGPVDALTDILEIEPGVRLAPLDATRIGCIEFDKAAGWDRAKAEAWLQRHRPVHDPERTAFLQHPYRFHRALAGLVQSVVRTGDWLPGAEPSDSRAVEFVAVPLPPKQDWPREGAGLELDLSASRFADRLPAGLRQGLPSRGFVNYVEAQAVIRRLETFAQKDLNGHPCRAAVLALYEGQVELLRRLIAQSEILRNSRMPLEIALPSRLSQREYDIVFLSLTRSHGHRAVAFGEDARELPLGLTRARTRLFLFGDPGNLKKRVTWHGPLDHLDAHAAGQELVRLARLLAFLQNQPTLAHANGKDHV